MTSKIKFDLMDHFKRHRELPSPANYLFKYFKTASFSSYVKQVHECLMLIKLLKEQSVQLKNNINNLEVTKRLEKQLYTLSKKLIQSFKQIQSSSNSLSNDQAIQTPWNYSNLLLGQVRHVSQLLNRPEFQVLGQPRLAQRNGQH